MAKYVLSIWDPEGQEQADPKELEKMFEAYGAFTKEARDKGAFLAGEALQPSSTTTVVRVKDGDTMTTDGPFAETKEQVSGFYLLECKDLDEAIEWAAKIPSATFGYGAIEVRPVLEVGG